MKLMTVSQAVDAVVAVPGSKSITNRALIIAALAKGQSTLTGLLMSEDTLACVSALRSCGVDIVLDEKNLTATIDGCAGKFPSRDAKIWCQDSGIVMRFLLAVCATQSGQYHFDGSARLCERPAGELLSVLTKLGARIDSENSTHLPCCIQGTALEGGDVVFDSDKSSQYISALLIAAPLMKNDLHVQVKNLKRSSFIRLTCDVMKAFGVPVEKENNTYTVSASTFYHGRDYAIEPDVSSASYFFAAAAVTQGSVTIKNLQRNQILQGDRQFIDVLEKMGCTVTQKINGLCLQGPKTLTGIDVNMNDFSDTFMTLACVAPFANSSTRITGLAHTRLQESDRIEAISDVLRRLQVRVETGDDWIKIYPGTPMAAVIDSHQDHRIAMSSAIIGLRVPGIELTNPECVAKTFPGFFACWTALLSRM